MLIASCPRSALKKCRPRASGKHRPRPVCVCGEDRHAFERRGLSRGWRSLGACQAFQPEEARSMWKGKSLPFSPNFLSLFVCILVPISAFFRRDEAPKKKKRRTKCSSNRPRVVETTAATPPPAEGGQEAQDANIASTTPSADVLPPEANQLVSL